MTSLGNGLSDGEHHEDALSVREAELAMLRRLGAPEGGIPRNAGQSCETYRALGTARTGLQPAARSLLKTFGAQSRRTL